MRSGILTPLVTALVLCAAPLCADGLHNTTKRFTPAAAMRQSDWSDPAELARPWGAALVRVPTGEGRSKRLTTSELLRWRPKTGAKHPVVVYMHGCSGIWSGTRARVKLMADLGFVVIAPASFARRKYARSCNSEAHRGSLYRGALPLRQFDAEHALVRLRALPFVDHERIVLMGFSEGAIVAATYRARQSAGHITHRVIEGWTCHAGWPEYDGLNAARNEPVLALLGANDPWFRRPALKGHCGTRMSRRNDSRSVVFTSPALARQHALLEHRQPRAELLNWLRAQNLLRREAR